MIKTRANCCANIGAYKCNENAVNCTYIALNWQQRENCIEYYSSVESKGEEKLENFVILAIQSLRRTINGN